MFAELGLPSSVALNRPDFCVTSMKSTETELKCLGIDVDAARKALTSIPEIIVGPRMLVRRGVVNLGGGTQARRQWLRLREENGIASLSLKRETDDPFVTHEIVVVVDSFDCGRLLLQHMGMGFSYQENYRQNFMDKGRGVTYSMDWWPGLDVFIEVEAVNKEELKWATLMLKGAFRETTTLNVADLYSLKYKVSPDWLHNECEYLTFENYKAVLLSVP